MSKENFKVALDFLFPSEGGYNNDKYDKGGPTNMGVTQATYNSWRKKKGLPLNDVKNINKDEAIDLYYEEYWKTSGADDVNDVDMAVLLFDTAVLHGPARAKQYYVKSGNDINKFLNIRQKSYDSIVASDSTQERFYVGWNNRVNNLRKNIRLGVFTNKVAQIKNENDLINKENFYGKSSNSVNNDISKNLPDIVLTIPKDNIDLSEIGSGLIKATISEYDYINGLEQIENNYNEYYVQKNYQDNQTESSDKYNINRNNTDNNEKSEVPIYTEYSDFFKDIPMAEPDSVKITPKNDDTYKESFEPVITGYATAINDENFENENSKNSSEKMNEFIRNVAKNKTNREYPDIFERHLDLKAKSDANKFKGYTNPITKTDKLYTKEEISEMTPVEYNQQRHAIEAQRKSVGIPTENEMKRISAHGGVVYVSAYTRGDGTQVKSYYRSAPKN